MYLTLYINHIIYLIVNAQNVCYLFDLEEYNIGQEILYFLIKNIQTKKQHLNAVVGETETY